MNWLRIASIRRRQFRPHYNKPIGRVGTCIQLQPELLLQCREDRNTARIRRLLVRSAVCRQRILARVRRPLQMEIVLVLQTCHIHNRPPSLSFGKKFRQRGHIHADGVEHAIATSLSVADRRYSLSPSASSAHPSRQRGQRSASVSTLCEAPVESDRPAGAADAVALACEIRGAGQAPYSSDHPPEISPESPPDRIFSIRSIPARPRADRRRCRKRS